MTTLTGVHLGMIPIMTTKGRADQDRNENEPPRWCTALGMRDGRLREEHHVGGSGHSPHFILTTIVQYAEPPGFVTVIVTLQIRSGTRL